MRPIVGHRHHCHQLTSCINEFQTNYLKSHQQANVLRSKCIKTKLLTNLEFFLTKMPWSFVLYLLDLEVAALFEAHWIYFMYAINYIKIYKYIPVFLNFSCSFSYQTIRKFYIWLLVLKLSIRWKMNSLGPITNYRRIKLNSYRLPINFILLRIKIHLSLFLTVALWFRFFLESKCMLYRTSVQATQQ